MSGPGLQGLGVGWRPELALAIDRFPALGFVEVLAEDLDGRPVPPALLRLRDRGVPIVVHGVSLSLGSAEGFDPRRADRLARVAEAVGAPWVSEHVCFVRAGGRESGHLLPLPRSSAALEVLAENVRAAQARLPVPLALENVAALFEWPDPERDEADFLAALLRETGCGLLLDHSNLYANARNHGWDARAALAKLPLERIAYCHVAGGTERGGLYHDTHAHPLRQGPLELVEALHGLAGPVGVLLERDDHFPPSAELYAELEAVRAAAERGRAGGRRAG